MHGWWFKERGCSLKGYILFKVIYFKFYFLIINLREPEYFPAFICIK